MEEDKEGQSKLKSFQEKAEKFANKMMFSSQDSNIGLVMQQPALQTNPQLFTNPRDKIRMTNEVKKVQYVANLFCNNLLFLLKERKPSFHNQQQAIQQCYETSVGRYLEQTDEIGSSYSDCKLKCYAGGDLGDIQTHDDLNECARRCKREFFRYFSDISEYYTKRHGFYKDEDATPKIRLIAGYN